MKQKYLFSCVMMFLLITASFGQVVEGVDYISILRSSAYDLNDKSSIPAFTYESSNHPELKALRSQYKLDSVAGFGNNISRILNILHWVHNTVKHDGQKESGIRVINAYEILNAATTKNVGVSCGELAAVLNDCYLAMGYQSRKVYCFPQNSSGKDMDSHVINALYLSKQNKWIWLDPTHDAYVMNEAGDLLSIEEVRMRLINKKMLILNPDANWNHKSSDTKESYLETYMAKNLYRMYCPVNSEYNTNLTDLNTGVKYIELVPKDYTQNKSSKTNSHLLTSNPKLFWAAPVNN